MPEPAATSPPPLAAGSGTGDEHVRVATRKLDMLMDHVGELLAAGLALDDLTGELGSLLPALRRSGTATELAGSFGRVHQGISAELRSIERISGDLREDAHATRLVPFALLFGGLPRVVRDLAREHHKEVRLITEGAEVEVDRGVLEALNAPLHQLVRNCIEHGFETSAERRAAGKEPAGSLRITARQIGSAAELTVADDGAGIDPAGLRHIAAENDFLPREEAAALPDRAALDLVFLPGLSTSPVVTELAGRGVGLDVVRHSVDQVQGIVAFDTTRGGGTTFRLRVPVGIATRTCLLVRDAGRLYALPVDAVDAVVGIGDRAPRRVAGLPVVTVDGDVLPLRGLADRLGSSSPGRGPGRGYGVVCRSLTRRAAFAVDEFIGIRDLVAQALPWPLHAGKAVSAVSVLAAGEAVPVVSVSSLVEEQARTGPARPPGAGPTALAEEGDATGSTAPLVLVAEDSLTTRTLERNILEAAGYRVRTVADGAAAWDLLHKETVALVVADVLMPGLDGFELTDRIRRDARLRDTPVVIVTSLGSAEDRRRGVEAGADAYIVKQDFDQHELLDIVRRLV